ncbi:unnamed protein product [Protopolystoma xenopodis]|uniref:Uncharacterized protein n=1 Tax=Protopolystoma xenopodis TaxID=117903 RepID=A0A3S5BE34_9PLAT|nr:unnamed protein product [Protopolystoma xenopodis]
MASSTTSSSQQSSHQERVRQAFLAPTGCSVISGPHKPADIIPIAPTLPFSPSNDTHLENEPLPSAPLDSPQIGVQRMSPKILSDWSDRAIRPASESDLLVSGLNDLPSHLVVFSSYLFNLGLLATTSYSSMVS